MPRVFVSAALAGWISVSSMRGKERVAVPVGASGMRQLWTPDLGNRRDDLPRHAQAVGSVVPNNVVGDEPEKWGQRTGSPESSRIGKLQDSLDVVAQAEASHGSP